MKFPLRERPFPSVPLSPSERKEYSRVVREVVDATIDEYDRYVRVDERRMNRTRWKPVKSREDVTVFKQLSRDPEAAIAAASRTRRQPAEASHWPLPKLVGVGTIAGTLEDIMYGIVTPDAPSIVVKTSYVKDELLDSTVLCEMKGATREDPFRYEGMKWLVMGHSAAINAVVWPRDFVFVESTGIETLANGDRIGFHALHSIDHAMCPEIESWGLVRSRFSTCYLYKQHRQGTVELYMMTYGDPGGNPPETIALTSAAASLIGIWKSMWCAQNKKLTWLLDNESARTRFRSARVSVASSREQRGPNDKSQCHLCSKTIRSFRSVESCQLCHAWVCSRCRVARTLSYSGPQLELRQRTVEICKNCMVRATSDDALRIAREHYGGLDEPETQQKFDGSKSRQQRTSSGETGGTLPTSTRHLELPEEPAEAGDVLLETQSCDPSDADHAAVAKVETIEDWERESAGRGQSTPSLRVSIAEDESLDHEQRLLLQMQSLCVAAEEAYHITAMNASYITEKPKKLHGGSDYKF